MKKIVLAIFVISMGTTAFAEQPELHLTCEGVHSETGAPVYGECNGGKFTGYFSQTGKPVYGKCDVKGRLTAYDPETGKQVLGTCKHKE